MKTVAVCATFLALAASTRANDEPSLSPPQLSLAALKQSFQFNPASLATEPEQNADVPPIIMAPFVVDDEATMRRLASAMEKAAQSNLAGKFSIQKGGALLKEDIGTAQLRVGIWGAASGYNFLKITW
jgi:hypothetical protein